MSSYLELLNLTREPFSNSPDPDAYYRTPTHEDCLNRLEIAIRLRRGLNVVLGEVGTGKSTLCRCLLRSLNEQSGIDVFLLLDAGFEDADEFVRHLCELFAGQRPPEGVARRECISVIQNRVFDKALEQNRNLVLFIDEGQKLSPAALEVLRELLNFETNTEKLLQIDPVEPCVHAIPSCCDGGVSLMRRDRPFRGRLPGGPDIGLPAAPASLSERVPVVPQIPLLRNSSTDKAEMFLKDGNRPISLALFSPTIRQRKGKGRRARRKKRTRDSKTPDRESSLFDTCVQGQ